MPDVVVLGDIAVDVLASVDNYPPKGGHALAEHLHMAGGGSAANTALILGRFGLEVTILARVGADPLADLALSILEEAGVDTSHVQRDAEAMTALLFVIVTPDGERTMLGSRGASARFGPADVDEAAIRHARWLHLSGYTLLHPPGHAAIRRAVEIARSADTAISLDVGVGPAYQCRDQILALLPALQTILPNDDEALELTGARDFRQAAEALQRAGVREVAVTCGAEGCYILTPDTDLSLPAFTVDAVDATGAGDAFNAGWIIGQLAGLSVRESALLACALGSLTVTIRGAGAALPGPKDLLAFLEAHRQRPEWEVWERELEAVWAFVGERVEAGIG
jgi:ribokinase